MVKDVLVQAMKNIEELSEKLGYKIKSDDYYIEDMGCPHKFPKSLPKGYGAVYLFVYGNDDKYEFLKIGKANQKSSARFVSQHYGFNAMSTLAKSICQDPQFQAMGLLPENVKEWMFRNLHRLNIYIKVECGKATTELVEAILHYQFRPRYEGNI